MKFRDYQYDQTGTQATTNLVVASHCVNILSAGTGQSELIGRVATLKSLNVIFQFKAAAFVGDKTAGKFCHLYVVLDRQPTGSITATDLFDGHPGFMLNLTNSRRFRVLRKLQVKDKVSYSTTYGSGSGYYTHDVSAFIDLKSIKSVYVDNATSSPNDIKSNALYCVIIREGGDASNLTGYNLVTRLRYTD